MFPAPKKGISARPCLVLTGRFIFPHQQKFESRVHGETLDFFRCYFPRTAFTGDPSLLSFPIFCPTPSPTTWSKSCRLFLLHNSSSGTMGWVYSIFSSPYMGDMGLVLVGGDRLAHTSYHTVKYIYMGHGGLSIYQYSLGS